jgi:methionyl-tRNA formyltransferase
MSSLTTPGWQLSRLPFNRRVIFLLKPIDDADSVAQLKKLNLDVGLHKSGVIYRDNTIKAFSLGILNPHIGILPAYRGRNVMEWSLLNGDPVGVSVFFIDTGIDTGSRIVVSEEVDISKFKSIPEAKRHLFDLDAMFFRKALVSLRSENPVYGVNDGSGRRHYVMSQLFQGVVQDLMLVNN